MRRENGFGPMDEDTKARLEALAELPDSDIDTTETKEWSDEDFSKAVPFLPVKPGKSRFEAL